MAYDNKNLEVHLQLARLIFVMAMLTSTVCLGQKPTPSVRMESTGNCSPNISGNYNVVNIPGCETLAQLQNRSNALAYDILEFDNDRHESPIEIRNELMAQNLIDTLKNDPSGFEKRKAGIRQRHEQTVAIFQQRFWPRVSMLEDDLGRAHVDTRPISRAIATDSPRKIALMLSLVAQRIGKMSPYPRMITPLEVEAIFFRMPKYQPSQLNAPASTPPVSIEVYQYAPDSNSNDLAKNLIAGLKQLNWPVNEEPIKLAEKTPRPTGIHLIFPSWDWTETVDFTNQFRLSELEITEDVVLTRQPPTVFKVEVWPAKDGNEVY